MKLIHRALTDTRVENRARGNHDGPALNALDLGGGFLQLVLIPRNQHNDLKNRAQAGVPWPARCLDLHL